MLVILKECVLFTIFSVLTVLRVVYIIVKCVILRVFPKKYKSIADDIILITGGGRGIGRQIALKFAKRKPKHIILWGRNEEPLRRTADDVLTHGVPCTIFTCDVCNRETVYKRVEEIKETIGDVTILVNNAGVFNGASVLDDTVDNIQKTFASNALAHIWTYKAFLPGMISQARGHIVTISSMLGMMPLKGASSYCGSKFASTGMAEALDLELLDYPFIHLTTVYPYQVANEMFKGLKLRFPWLIPALSEELVANATVSAVLTNQKSVLMPAIMYILVPCLSLFPARAMAPFYKFLGVSSALDEIMEKNTKVE